MDQFLLSSSYYTASFLYNPTYIGLLPPEGDVTFIILSAEDVHVITIDYLCTSVDYPSYDTVHQCIQLFVWILQGNPRRAVRMTCKTYLAISAKSSTVYSTSADRALYKLWMAFKQASWVRRGSTLQVGCQLHNNRTELQTFFFFWVLVENILSWSRRRSIQRSAPCFDATVSPFLETAVKAGKYFLLLTASLGLGFFFSSQITTYDKT